MKKLLSLLLAVLLLASVGTTVFADGKTETFEENGVSLQYTEAFENTKGVFYPYPGGYDYDTGVGAVVFWYFAMPQEELDVLFEKDDDQWTEADDRLYRSRQGELLELVSINGGRGTDDLLEMISDLGVSDANFVEVGSCGDVTFFAVMIPEITEEYLAGIAPAYRTEFEALQNELLEVLKSGEYSEPVVKGADLIGTKLSFETTDVDGNPVKIEDIFRENEITMINVWATWCDNCVRELGELAEMNKRLAEKNVAVIGICTDADEMPDECRTLMDENSVDYLNLLPFDGIEDALQLEAFPTSYFVDREGTIISLPYRGAPMDMSPYEAVIDGLLNGEETMPEAASTQSENGLGVYRVIVADDAGRLVKGAVIQFCSDTTCTMGKTDENGVAEFEAEEGSYTVHVLKIPEGYQPNSEEFTTNASYSDLHIVLKKVA